MDVESDLFFLLYSKIPRFGFNIPRTSQRKLVGQGGTGLVRDDAELNSGPVIHVGDASLPCLTSKKTVRCLHKTRKEGVEMWSIVGCRKLESSYRQPYQDAVYADALGYWMKQPDVAAHHTTNLPAFPERKVKEVSL